MLSNYINKILRKLNIIIIFRNGNAIGEIVYLTSLINCLYLENSNYKIIILTKYPEIFLYNKKIFINLRIYNNLFYKLIFFIFFRISGTNIVDFNPEKNQLKNDTNFLKSYPINTHLALVTRKFKLNLKSNSIKNEFFFSNQEKIIFEKKMLLPNEFAVIHSQAKLTYAKNKDWGYVNMQKVINLTPEIKWVQVGLSSEPLLENSIHRLNVTLRELAYIIFRSKFVLTLEGLYNHLSSCFDKKTFIILSGMLPAAASHYKNNVTISKFHDLDCAPCYRLNSCVKSEKYCTTQITPEYVVNMINKNF